MIVFIVKLQLMNADGRKCFNDICKLQRLQYRYVAIVEIAPEHNVNMWKCFFYLKSVVCIYKRMRKELEGLRLYNQLKNSVLNFN